MGVRESPGEDNWRGSYVVLLDEASGTAVASKLEFLVFSRREKCAVCYRVPCCSRSQRVWLAATTAPTNTPTTPTTPTTPNTPAVTETFNGTLTKNGGLTFPFTATAGGTVAVTLSSVADSSLQIGLSLGTWTGSACQIVIANDAAAQSAIVTGTVTSAASLCVRVYDPAEKVSNPSRFHGIGRTPLAMLSDC